MHTVQSADDIVATEPLVMEVERLERFVDPSAPDSDVLHVFRESEPVWLAPDALAPFKNFVDDLSRYSPRPDNEHPACIVLADKESSKPMLPITDPSTPTCIVTAALEAQGWQPHKHLVHHEALLQPGAHAYYDSRAAVRQKWYYQVLYDLPATLPLCGGSMPSVQPM